MLIDFDPENGSGFRRSQRIQEIILKGKQNFNSKRKENRSILGVTGYWGGKMWTGGEGGGWREENTHASTLPLRNLLLVTM